MELSCPLCHATLPWQRHHVHCCHCDKTFMVQARCPACHQLLEELVACGAVDYFCANGHGLLSKKRVAYCLVPSEER